MKVNLTEREAEMLREALVCYYDLDFVRHTHEEQNRLMKKLRPLL